VYSVIGHDDLPKVVPGVAAAGWTVAALALIARQPALLPLGLAGVGAAYALFLSLGMDAVDRRAPLVAAMLLLAAEFGFWSLEPRDARAERGVLVRRLVLIAVAALGAALLASLLLVAASDVSGGVGLEALGVLAAVVTVLIVAVLTARSRDSSST
jgi:FtsH-binding integral membrane protein